MGAPTARKRHSILLTINAAPALSTLALSALIFITPVFAQSRRPTEKKPIVSAGQRAPTQDSVAFDQLARRAGVAREANQLSESINLYQQALKMQPSWTEGWWYLGTLLYELDRYTEARDALRRFVTLEPKAGPGYALMGLCEFQLREYERALVNIQRGRALGLGDSEQLTFVTRYHAAILLTRFEFFEGATEILHFFARTQTKENPKVTEAIGLSVLRLPLLPSDISADKRDLVLRAGRAASHHAARRLVDARKEFEQLVALYPETPNVHYAYGVFLLDDNPDAAAKQFQRELKISPSHVPARLQIAFTHIKNRDYAAGLPLAEEAVRLDPASFPARNALGRILIETGDVARAIKELEAGVKQAPDSPEMHFALARAYTRAGRKEDAKQARANFLRLDKLRRDQRGESQSASALEANPDNPTPR
ncbi:MAG: tetratricopeptide repeat protein [Acidobacteria bacterium]|nr:tetratricopeptide repeat protein [Acidobacteriota bacterium]